MWPIFSTLKSTMQLKNDIWKIKTVSEFLVKIIKRSLSKPKFACYASNHLRYAPNKGTEKLTHCQQVIMNALALLHGLYGDCVGAHPLVEGMNERTTDRARAGKVAITTGTALPLETTVGGCSMQMVGEK